MKILSSSVPTDRGTIETVDTIEHNGMLWLVPFWIDDKNSDLSMPGRMVCLSLLPHQETQKLAHDYVVNTPLPNAVFDYDEPPPQQPGLVIVDPMRTQMRKTRRVN